MHSTFRYGCARIFSKSAWLSKRVKIVVVVHDDIDDGAEAVCPQGKILLQKITSLHGIRDVTLKFVFYYWLIPGW